MRLAITTALLCIPTPSVAAVEPAFVYCSTPSNSTRGQGLILTSIFQSRSELAFVESAFTNYLRTSYAPYGNGWIFSERQTVCAGFHNRREAEIKRSLDMSRVPQPTRSIYIVSFQIG